MSVTAKDFIAEATDIAEYLTPHVSSLVIAQYVSQRCATLLQSNPLFDRDKFTNMAFGLIDPKASSYDELREIKVSKAEAMERLLTLRSVLDIHRVVPFRCGIDRDHSNPDENTAWSYHVSWRGSDILSTSMRDAFSVVRTVQHG